MLLLPNVVDQVLADVFGPQVASPQHMRPLLCHPLFGLHLVILLLPQVEDHRQKGANG